MERISNKYDDWKKTEYYEETDYEDLLRYFTRMRDDLIKLQGMKKYPTRVLARTIAYHQKAINAIEMYMRRDSGV